MSNQPTTSRDEARDYVNRVLLQAAEDGATEIQLIPDANTTRIIERVGEESRPLPEPPPQLVNLIVERIKTMAEMDLDELSEPQKGRVLLSINAREYMVHLETTPTDHGENVTLKFV